MHHEFFCSVQGAGTAPWQVGSVSYVDVEGGVLDGIQVIRNCSEIDTKRVEKFPNLDAYTAVSTTHDFIA